MAFITGDVVPDSHGSGAFQVVFRAGAETIVEWNVYSEILGKAKLLKG